MNIPLSKLFLSTLLFSINNIVSTTAYTRPGITCNDIFNEFCLIMDVKLEKSKHLFEPNKLYLNDFGHVRTVSIKCSAIPTFTAGYTCEKFENLTELDAQDVEITELYEVNAFNSCKNLKILHLNGNNIKFLPKNIFSDAHQLSHLNLHDNELIYIHENAFDGLENLEMLSLYSNNLIHFDIVRFIEPLKLKNGTINIQDNLIKCQLVRDIVYFMNTTTVVLSKYYDDKTNKVRDFELSNYDDYICISDEVYQMIYVEKLLEFYPDAENIIDVDSKQKEEHSNETRFLIDFAHYLLIDNVRLQFENDEMIKQLTANNISLNLAEVVHKNLSLMTAKERVKFLNEENDRLFDQMLLISNTQVDAQLIYDNTTAFIDNALIMDLNNQTSDELIKQVLHLKEQLGDKNKELEEKNNVIEKKNEEIVALEYQLKVFMAGNSLDDKFDKKFKK